jgi:nucleoside-diphosphate-sugar epimerase
MRVLVTGHDGYIGPVLCEQLLAAGHEVHGLDVGWFEGCGLQAPAHVPAIWRDVRDVTPADFAGFDAVCHLAALSNDPLGELNPSLTEDVNTRASLRVAEAAKAAGVSRFLFSSSCSTYGAAEAEGLVDEHAPLRPQTAYAVSKVRTEERLSALADSDFTPVYLRNATVYGLAPRLRCDLVVNNLTAWACTTGRIVLQSDGSPWRPLIHVRDVANAFVALLAAPRRFVHNEAFNVGAPGENYRVRDVAEIVGEVVPGCRVEISADASPDTRSYRVDFTKLQQLIPKFHPAWTVRDAVVELAEAYALHGLTEEQFQSSRYVRLRRISELVDEARLDADLRRPLELTAA